MPRIALLSAGLLNRVSVAPAPACQLNLGAGVGVFEGVGSFPGNWPNTFNGGVTLYKVIDAPSAAATEVHSQTSQIW
jgi:hypothetical protein